MVDGSWRHSEKFRGGFGAGKEIVSQHDSAFLETTEIFWTK
jgi:hypothetical protein